MNKLNKVPKAQTNKANTYLSKKTSKHFDKLISEGFNKEQISDALRLYLDVDKVIKIVKENKNEINI